MSVQRTPMTRTGFERLKDELDRLKRVERPTIIKAIAEARAHGDLSENAEYHAAREKQSFIEGRINDLESKVGGAEVIDVPSGGDRVTFASTVRLEDEAGKEVRYWEKYEELARKTYIAILDVIEPPKPKVAEGQIAPDDPVALELAEALRDGVEATPGGGRRRKAKALQGRSSGCTSARTRAGAASAARCASIRWPRRASSRLRRPSPHGTSRSRAAAGTWSARTRKSASARVASGGMTRRQKSTIDPEKKFFHQSSRENMTEPSFRTTS